jgi:hypothetical protein
MKTHFLKSFRIFIIFGSLLIPSLGYSTDYLRPQEELVQISFPNVGLSDEQICEQKWEKRLHQGCLNEGMTDCGQVKDYKNAAYCICSGEGLGDQIYQCMANRGVDDDWNLYSSFRDEEHKTTRKVLDLR